ncbi:hypothetical protein SLA2020_339390 [Shorea laevis]
MASFDLLDVNPCEEDSPRIRGCSFRGSACSMFRDAEDDMWLALLDQFKFEIQRAFGRVKKGWQGLGLGLKTISGPLGFKGAYLPKPFKTRKFLLPRGP